MKKPYKVGESTQGVSKPNKSLKKNSKDKTYKKTQERCVEDDVMANTGLIINAEDFKVRMEERCAASTKSSLSPEAIGYLRKVAQPNAALVWKLLVASDSSSALTSGDASTKKSTMVGVRTQKPTGIHSEAAESKPKQDGVIMRKQTIS